MPAKHIENVHPRLMPLWKAYDEDQAQICPFCSEPTAIRGSTLANERAQSFQKELRDILYYSAFRTRFRCGTTHYWIDNMPQIGYLAYIRSDWCGAHSHQQPAHREEPRCMTWESPTNGAREKDPLKRLW